MIVIVVSLHASLVPKLPIYSAWFVGNSGNVVVSGRRPFFYLYDSIAGKLDHIPRLLGRSERSLEKCVVSPDGRTIAFLCNDGHVVLFDSKTKSTRMTFKLNGSVRAVCFDGEWNLWASGSDGDVYQFDLRHKKCRGRFPNQDGSITSTLSCNDSMLGVGAESGVVNLYQNQTGDDFNQRTPIKSILNLRTSADHSTFNTDGQILSFSSRREKDALKLLHVPSSTVFSNWPTSKTPLGYVWSTAFSPESRFLAVGNDQGKCLLYKLTHYERSG